MTTVLLMGTMTAMPTVTSMDSLKEGLFVLQPGLLSALNSKLGWRLVLPTVLPMDSLKEGLFVPQLGLLLALNSKLDWRLVQMR